MRRAASTGWASFLLWLLLGLVPGGQRALPTTGERSLTQAEQRKPPLGNHQPTERELKLSGQPARHGWPLETALPGAAPVATFRFLALDAAVSAAASPVRLKRIAFPYLTTGPPTSTL